jgi:hypothetical protein
LVIIQFHSKMHGHYKIKFKKHRTRLGTETALLTVTR